jgi:hypothetical protein
LHGLSQGPDGIRQIGHRDHAPWGWGLAKHVQQCFACFAQKNDFGGGLGFESVEHPEPFD